MNGISPNTLMENVIELELCLEILPSIDPLMKLTSLKNLTVSNSLLLNIPKEIE